MSQELLNNLRLIRSNKPPNGAVPSEFYLLRRKPYEDKGVNYRLTNLGAASWLNSRANHDS
jgi:hypothetical protein